MIRDETRGLRRSACRPAPGLSGVHRRPDRGSGLAPDQRLGGGNGVPCSSRSWRAVPPLKKLLDHTAQMITASRPTSCSMSRGSSSTRCSPGLRATLRRQGGVRRRRRPGTGEVGDGAQSRRRSVGGRLRHASRHRVEGVHGEHPQEGWQPRIGPVQLLQHLRPGGPERPRRSSILDEAHRIRESSNSRFTKKATVPTGPRSRS